MNSHHKNGKDDRSLDHELDQLDQLYHSGESIEPPDMIDQAVLNKARLAVKPKNGWLDFGWIHAVTTVALVVLTFSIFITQREAGEFESPLRKSLERTSSEVMGQAVEADMPAADEEAAPVTAAPAASKSVQSPVQSAVHSPDTIKEEIQQDYRTGDEGGAQRQMRATASATPEQAAKIQAEEKDQLKSADKLDSASESEASRVISQQHILNQILTLKQAGDDRWIKELSDFKKLYPDFPLPEELQDKD